MTRRLLAIAGLTGLAIAQPILDLFGNSPATFQVNRVEGVAIVAFAIAVVAIPPVVLWLVGEGVRRIHHPTGALAHSVTIGALCGLVGILIAKEVSGITVLNAAVGLIVGGLGLIAYRRFEPVGMWVRLLSAANLFFLFHFVFLAPVADWIDSGRNTALALEAPVAPDARVGADAATGAADDELRPPSVVMIILDEWPTLSILTEEQMIDEVRFPNVAAFAQEATWYRRFSVASPFTQSAVPALLDGLEPFGEPTWVDHPDNLFSLLAGSHHLIVSEVLTQMCGFDTCGVRPVPPSPPSAAEEPGGTGLEEPMPVEPTTVEVDTDPRWGTLLDTAWRTWKARVGPARPGPVESFDDFREELNEVETPAPSPPPDDAGTGEAVQDRGSVGQEDADAGLTEEELELDRFLSTLVGSQPGRHLLFVDALRPTDDPFFGYLHLVMPHQPWILREDGTAYEVAADRTDYEADNDDPWPVLVGQQRHLLQAEYADRLLGMILRRLDDIGEYDDSLIVVVGDHGVAFEAGESSRRVSERNLGQIAYSPLLIKAPGQSRGAIDDSNLNSTDLTPTIADLLGLDLPWPTDGHAAGSPEIAARGGDKYIYNYTDAFDYTFLGVVEYDDGTEFAAMTQRRFPAIEAGDDRLRGLYRDVPGSDLIGEDPGTVFGPIRGTVSVAELDRLLRPGAGGPLLGEVAGRVADAPGDATVVVAVNERVVGVSPLYRRGGREGSFVVLLPTDALRPAPNSLRIALHTADGSVAELAIED